ncbi:hypothetical protein P152DRAFT_42364 [Eremomyces bilateralis CBS 781.70]|uniref:Uncharacterized protein n=1 Tax=Eremomyces bilateralis CBS 781.70 TaxID=1392243 RepID=A0A6G1G1P2_9PEZI|nr:uncharacterized protein P152DRAFT_42364 [Eremomyces bilateralis CBS 781.70]KAF1812027.1 hypothetical protein P152DRAFT_42364 [Eremomyces bilateralis CBS 781.70]
MGMPRYSHFIPTSFPLHSHFIPPYSLLFPSIPTRLTSRFRDHQQVSPSPPHSLVSPEGPVPTNSPKWGQILPVTMEGWRLVTV